MKQQQKINNVGRLDGCIVQNQGANSAGKREKMNRVGSSTKRFKIQSYLT